MTREASQQSGGLFWFGLAGLAGALLTGLGEGLLQLVPNGDFADPTYNYFGDIWPPRLALGHWIAVLAAPLYLPGYWHLTGRLLPHHPRARFIVFALMGWALILAFIWIGQRALLAHTVHAIAEGDSAAPLLDAQTSLHGPLVNALRLAILGFSLLWIGRIATGRSTYPRWMALFSPGLILGAIFLTYIAAPGLGWLVLPTAMNTAHAVVFALSLTASHKEPNV